MESHDAEFREGVTLYPKGEKLAIDSLTSPRTFNPEDLDNKWRELAAEHDAFILPLEQSYQETCQKMEALLVTLREHAQKRLEADQGA